MTTDVTAISRLPNRWPETPYAPDNSIKVKDAASQFEALLIGQLLKTAREAGGSGWLGTGEDHAGETALELAEQHFAQVMAAQGGLGLARLVLTGLQTAEKAASTRE
jgi:Rod binding domain-containing protein